MNNSPLIGINMDFEPDARGGQTAIRPAYWQSVVRAGGVPVLVPPLDNRAQLERILAKLDGFLMIGGDDIRGERFGEATHPAADTMTPEREASDFLLWELLLARRTPTLGICLAFQELNVLRGGSLYQDLPSDGPPSTVSHFSKTPGYSPPHAVRLESSGWLSKIWDGQGDATVNSSHHQAIKKLGEGLQPLAYAPDGLIEALQIAELPFCLAVQWHPERMPDDARQAKLFEALVAHAINSGRE